MIYLAFDFKTNLTKIGFSDNPDLREKSLQTAAPNLKIVFTAAGTRQTEKELHKQYKEYHVIGEWYSLDKSVIYIILNQFAEKSSLISVEMIEKINVEYKEFREDDLTNYFNNDAARLLGMLWENKQNVYNLKIISHNLFLSVPQTLKILNKLRKDKILKYKKVKDLNIEIEVNWNYVQFLTLNLQTQPQLQ